jgi:hypothetical protein
MATTSTSASMPNPRNHPLLALQYILYRYLPLGGPAWLRVPEDFKPLKHLFYALNYFVQEGYVSTLMCVLIPLFLEMMDRQYARKKAVYGGWLHPNRFTPADLEQQPADREALRRLGTDALFQLLKEELRLLFRLLRAAQEAYRKEFTYEDGWLPIHKAATVVLLRIAQISAALRHKGGRFLAEECVRYQAQVVWNEQFSRARAPRAHRHWLQPIKDMPPKGKKSITIHLWKEQAAGRPIPAPFVKRFPIWARELSA